MGGRWLFSLPSPMKARPSNHGVAFWCDDTPSPYPRPISANVTMFYLQLLFSLVVPREGVGIKGGWFAPRGAYRWLSVLMSDKSPRARQRGASSQCKQARSAMSPAPCLERTSRDSREV